MRRRLPKGTGLRMLQHAVQGGEAVRRATDPGVFIEWP